MIAYRIIQMRIVIEEEVYLTYGLQAYEQFCGIYRHLFEIPDISPNLAQLRSVLEAWNACGLAPVH